MTWWNDYVGIPYASGGRTRLGADCWGLVRLVYSEQFDRQLPSFADEYDDAAQRERIEEIVAREVEGWKRADAPSVGDVVLFRVRGRLSHVGIAIGEGQFLHAREGHAATIERLSSGSWKHRLEGFYQYVPNSVVLAGCPHPLKTERIDTVLPEGMTLAQVRQWIADQGPHHIPHDAVLMLDGKVIPAELLDQTTTLPGQRIEYRAVMRGSSAGRIIGMIAVVVAVAVFQQYYLAPYLAGAGYGTIAASGAITLTAAGTAMSAVAGAALTIAGSMLVNQIFPVRQPTQRNPGQANSQLMLQGGSNQANPYGSIPVVLGRFRYTPPIGAINYVESNSTTAYMRMLLVWGYGPLQISDLRIGATPLEQFEEVEYETLTGLGDTPQDLSNFNRLYGQDVSQQAFNVKLESDGTDAGSPWTEHVITDVCDRISVTLHFPEGLRQMPTEGSNAGKADPASFIGKIQVRQIDPDTMTPITTWGEINALFNSQAVNLQPAWFNVDNDAELEKVYRWTRLSLNENNVLIVRQGAFTSSPGSEPSGSLLARQQEAAFGINATYNRLPDYGDSEEPLWDICMYGDAVYSKVDRRGTGTSGVIGCGLTVSGFLATIASGTIARAQLETIHWGGVGESYYKRKDAFTANVSFSVPNGMHEVRVCRRNDSTKEFTYPSGNKGMRYHDAYLVAITGYEVRRPVVEPTGVKLAMTAIRIKATNQLNGNVDGISGTVHAICKDWDSATGTWITRPTRNPASLIRHVLQHPGNAQRVTDSQIDLTALADFHTYCRLNKFMFDMMLTQQNSVYDTLRDIAAAGRASPTLRDGKWTVIIDRPRTTIAQHFTPHNSWGFEGVRALPKLPHAFRVQFNNAEKGYQPDEMIVYNDGYSSSNATLFEGLQLPGVTTREAVFKHARFHLAQIKLRPETYSLNADMEHLICTRGDLVRVTHDVPMWGLGTGRIRQWLSSTVLKLDEPVPMDAGVQYTIRIRTQSGSSVTRTVQAVAEDGEYSDITLADGVTADEGKAGNLFMFGSLNSESVELVVLGIEPSGNMNARISLVDYAPAVYDSDTETIPAFDSQVTRPPALLIATISDKPTITAMVSDESVMSILSPGQYAYNIKVSFTNPQSLPHDVSYLEGQIDFVGDGNTEWSAIPMAPIAGGAVVFGNVEEGAQYRLRLRYVDRAGRTGPWTDIKTHTVIGKTTPPPYVDYFKLIEQPGGVRQFFWSMASVPPDLFAYEVRYSLGTTQREWDRMIHLFAKDHRASSHENMEPVQDGVYTFAIRAIDTGGRMSSQPHYITEVLDGDQFGAVVKIVLPHEQEWPGIKTDCYVSGTLLTDSGVLTWEDLDMAWDDTEATWENTPASPIIYEHPVIDLEASLEVTLRANSLASGSTVMEVSTSDDDMTYSEWASVPSSSITARYFKLRWTVSGSSPLLYRAQVIFYT